jgi:SPP1 gp7 family putative phage head morphogenesis protein
MALDPLARILPLPKPTLSMALNGRDPTKDLDTTIDNVQPNLTRNLNSLWRGQAAVITEAGVAESLQSNEIQPEWRNEWAESTQGFVEDDLKARWFFVAALGADNIARGVEKNYPQPINVLRSPSFPSERAIDLMNKRGLSLAKGLSDTQVTASRTVLSEGIKLGRNPKVVARSLVDSIGLTNRESLAVVNRRAQLTEAALKARKGKPLTPFMVRRIDGRAATYAKRLKRQRAVRIARTEMSWAHNRGQLDAIDAYKEVGWLPANVQVLKEWITTLDERTCPFCAGLDGTILQGDGVYIDTSGNPIPAPPAHPHCRCSIAVIVGSGNA